MHKLLYKERRLAALPISYIFTAFALLTLVPNYPILLGAFFTTLGIFQSFRVIPQNNDIGYSLLLPVAKADIVKGKFAFVLLIELMGFVLMLALTLLRMTLLRTVPLYENNALMSANFVFLGFALLLFGLFNVAFVRGFFKTAYDAGKPFVRYCVLSFLAVAFAEALHFVPGLAALNTPGLENMGLQLGILTAGAVLFALLTVFALKSAVKRFEALDL